MWPCAFTSRSARCDNPISEDQTHQDTGSSRSQARYAPVSAVWSPGEAQNAEGKVIPSTHKAPGQQPGALWLQDHGESRDCKTQ